MNGSSSSPRPSKKVDPSLRRATVPRMVPSFPWSQASFNDLFRGAVGEYWKGRSQQARKQKRTGGRDAGTRGEVTGGQHLNAFAHLLIQVIRAAGIPADAIHFDKPLVLPGYYRSQKKWDIVVSRDRELLAAIELEAHLGRMRADFNRRIEGILGRTRDFWTAYRERAFQITPRPWLGQFLLLPDEPALHRPAPGIASPFPPRPEFVEASMLDHYRMFAERLFLERDVSGVALVALPPASRSPSFNEPHPDLPVFRFARALYEHVQGCAHEANGFAA